jgi:hypothetical protein
MADESLPVRMRCRKCRKCRKRVTRTPLRAFSAFSAFSASTLETNGDEDGGGSGEESTWTV